MGSLSQFTTRKKEDKCKLDSIKPVLFILDTTLCKSCCWAVWTRLLIDKLFTSTKVVGGSTYLLAFLYSISQTNLWSLLFDTAEPTSPLSLSLSLSAFSIHLCI